MTFQASLATNKNPIGIIDSGVGGLSIAKEIHAQLPHESLIYVADTLHAPYGEKSEDFIKQRINNLTEKLLKQNIKALVIACNTATVSAIDQLREKISIPVIGVEPAIKPAAQESKSKNIGILVTQATATNQRFLSLVNRYKNNTNVHIQACPNLVELIENGQLNDSKCVALLNHYLQPLIANNIDRLVLGCTHYPFLIPAIKNIVGDKIKIMETASPVTNELKRQLAKHKLYSQTSPINTSTQAFFSTHKTEKLTTVFTALWSKPMVLKQFNSDF